MTARPRRATRSPGRPGSDVESTLKDYRKAIAKAPKLEADEAALQMVTALEEMLKPVREAAQYYDNRKYREDGCKRGKELHPLLMAAWGKFVQGDRAVRAFVDKYNDERQVTELAEAQKKYGKGFHYHHLKLIMDAKALVRALQAVPKTPTPEVGPVRDRLSVLQQTLADTKALVAKEKGGKNRDAMYQGGFEQLLTYGDAFKEGTDNFLRAIEKEAKTPPKASPKSGSKSSATDTTPRKRALEEALDSYNHLVDQANQTVFSKGMK